MATASYRQLLVETLPARIDSEERYDAMISRLSELLRKRRTAAEDKLADLLAVLIQEFDRRHAMPPEESTPAERLQFLLEHSGKTAADLLRVFHQRSHVNEALNGKRPIGLEQARQLGKLFHVKPALFIS